MTMSLTRDEARASASGMTAEERKVILASSFGALMEWYDFYIYAALAVYFGACSSPRAMKRPPSWPAWRRSAPAS